MIARLLLISLFAMTLGSSIASWSQDEMPPSVVSELPAPAETEIEPEEEATGAHGDVYTLTPPSLSGENRGIRLNEEAGPEPPTRPPRV